MSALADHVWQSTWFALAAAFLTLLVSRSDARARYWIWFAASLKFLVPFSLLTLLGRQFVWQVEDQALLPLVQHVAAPLTGTHLEIESIGDRAAGIVGAIWACGALLLLCRWFKYWRRSRALVRHSTPWGVASRIPICATQALHEPGVVGIRDPVVLIPAPLLATLTPAELDAIVAHELWHVRRRDNLTAAVHSLVQALFWFHPLVWWLGTKLIETREQACDQGALKAGANPQRYAAALLRVCRYSVESREPCVAGAAGGNLAARVRAIMSSPRACRFRVVRQAIVAALLASCVALPVTAGIQVISTAGIQVAAGAKSIWPSRGGPAFFTAKPDFIYARNVSLRELISHAYGVDVHEVNGHVAWLDRPRYDVELQLPRNVPRERVVAELLKERFNLVLRESPTAPSQLPGGLDF